MEEGPSFQLSISSHYIIICSSSSNGTDTFVLDMALRNSALVELIKCK